MPFLTFTGDTVSMKECLKYEAVFSIRSSLLRRLPPSLVVESRVVMARHQIFYGISSSSPRVILFGILTREITPLARQR
ncbi:hypothetical protein TIFTF001_002887 [Ficus carica]|uniref:Uncharacterized protein n=1 Tax=Ficus carica TaxID=3494 RepID=A0AA88D940_FICCA|nr:hypothetical protein TIFTF001_002887 [Ficus carica]